MSTGTGGSETQTTTVAYGDGDRYYRDGDSGTLSGRRAVPDAVPGKRKPIMARHPEIRSERGVSLLEVMFALAILSAVLIALGSLMYQVAQRTMDSAAAGYRSAAVTSAASWAERLPWDSIDLAVGCRNDSTGQLVYVQCTSVQTVAAGHKSISIVVSPTGRLVVAPDTVTVERRRTLSLSPFKVN